jgi:hypothetical protein
LTWIFAAAEAVAFDVKGEGSVPSHHDPGKMQRTVLFENECIRQTISIRVCAFLIQIRLLPRQSAGLDVHHYSTHHMLGETSFAEEQRSPFRLYGARRTKPVAK